jgi:hypothetical protein
MFIRIFETVVEVKLISVKDKFESKKYLGVSRCETKIVARIISRFPRI